MNKNDMVISHVFDMTKLNVGKCYQFRCGESGERQGILTNITEQSLTFSTASKSFYHKYECTLCSYVINATDFYNDDSAYIIELV